MSAEEICPTTVEGIKRLAKQIKREHLIPYSEALNLAAQRAGYQNFNHAHRVLKAQSLAPKTRSLHRVFVTMYWRDNRQSNRGRETLAVDLEADWRSLIDPSKFRYTRYLEAFKVSAPDHLECHYLVDSQSNARRRICAAARALIFMDATHLTPCKGYNRVFKGNTSVNDLPGRDHYSIWYDRKTRRYLFVDEPYEPAVEDRSAERQEWAAARGIEVARPSWPGMYNPDGGSQIYLFSQRGTGVPLGPIVAKLDSLPLPIVEDSWSGDSAPASPLFFSPRHGQRALLKSVESPSRSKGVRGKRQMHPARKLLVAGVNHLLSQNLMSLDGTGGEKSYCEAVIAGRNSIIQWHDGGFQELQISVWWDYDHSHHPQANLEGNFRERFQTGRPLAKRRHWPKFVGATVSGWLEREKGKYLQGHGLKGLTDIYMRQDALPVLRELPAPEPKGFLAEGKFMM